MFCSAVRCGKRLKDWNTIPTSSRIFRMSEARSVTWSSSIQISPEVRCSSRLTHRSIVLFPLPDGPMIEHDLAGLDVRFTLFSATTLPKVLHASTIRSPVRLPHVVAIGHGGHPLFHQRHEPGEEQGHHEVHQGHHGEGLEVVERLRGILPPLRRRSDTARMDTREESFSSAMNSFPSGRQNHADGLRQDDPLAGPARA